MAATKVTILSSERIANLRVHVWEGAPLGLAEGYYAGAVEVSPRVISHFIAVSYVDGKLLVDDLETAKDCIDFFKINYGIVDTNFETWALIKQTNKLTFLTKDKKCNLKN